MSPVSAFQWVDLLLLRPTLVIITVSLIVIACRSRSAATRHWLVCCALCSLPLMPLLHWTLPNSSVELLPTEWQPQQSTTSLQTTTETASVNWFLVIYLSVALTLLVRLIAQLLATRKLRQQLSPLQDAKLLAVTDELRRAMNITRPVSLQYSNREIPPIAFGMTSPVVALPRTMLDRDPAELRAILTHELAHIKRCDWAVSLAVRAICALFWFLPWVWWLRYHLETLAENACDDQVLKLGTPDYCYAKTLVALARDRDCRTAMAAFKKRAGLYWRISELLNDRISHRPLTPTTKSFLLLASSLIIIPLASVQATAIARPPATEQFINPLFLARLAAMPDEAPTEPFDALEDDTPALQDADIFLPEIDNPITESGVEVDVPEDEAIEESPLTFAKQVVNTAPKPQPKPEPEPIFFPEEISVAPPPVDIERHRVVKKRKPRYPRRALEKGIEGTVTVEYTITADGNVSNATIVDADPAGVFDRAVLSALKRYHFEPQRINGDPVHTTQIRNLFTFRLDDPVKKRRRR